MAEELSTTDAYDVVERTGSACIIEPVVGDSCYNPKAPNAPGSLYPGDYVFIDTDDTCPAQPGPYAVFDGCGVVIKLVERIPGSDPTRLRLTSRNPAYQPFEVTEGEAHIIGRVRGRISAM